MYDTGKMSGALVVGHARDPNSIFLEIDGHSYVAARLPFDPQEYEESSEFGGNSTGNTPTKRQLIFTAWRDVTFKICGKSHKKFQETSISVVNGQDYTEADLIRIQENKDSIRAQVKSTLGDYLKITVENNVATISSNGRFFMIVPRKTPKRPATHNSEAALLRAQA